MLLTALTGIVCPTALLAQSTREFMVESLRLQGTDRTVCILTGEWPDGSALRYQAWDECSRLRVRQVALDDVRNASSLGVEDDVSIGDIPLHAPIVEIANAFSTVIIFPDGEGATKEILISD